MPIFGSSRGPSGWKGGFTVRGFDFPLQIILNQHLLREKEYNTIVTNNWSFYALVESEHSLREQRPVLYRVTPDEWFNIDIVDGVAAVRNGHCRQWDLVRRRYCSSQWLYTRTVELARRQAQSLKDLMIDRRKWVNVGDRQLDASLSSFNRSRTKFIHKITSGVKVQLEGVNLHRKQNAFRTSPVVLMVIRNYLLSHPCW